MTDFSLIETMRWQPGTGIVRLRLHLARLKRSARRLGFMGADKVEARLAEAVPPSVPEPVLGLAEGKTRGGHLPLKGGDQPSASQRPTNDTIRGASAIPISPLEGEMPGRAEGGNTAETAEFSQSPLRVRLTLSPTGDITVTTAPFTPLPENTVWRVAIASNRLDSTNKLLRYKTTLRAIYEAARAEYPVTEADEVLLLNERGEPCEGTITSLFLDDGSGVLKTPPISCGLLAGVLRTELICARRARVQRLTLQDLRSGTLFMGNSLRGLIRAELASA